MLAVAIGGRHTSVAQCTVHKLKYREVFQCFTVHFFISLNDKHQHNTLHTQQ